MKQPYIHVTAVSSRGWFDAFFTLRQFSKARRQLSSCDLLFVTLEGDLITP